jgi:hypothetical protein
MSLPDELNDSDRETLRKLLKLSGRAALERRRALCIEIGIDSGEISGIGLLSENDFAVELIDLLVNRELEEAVFKLCETLKRDFDRGIISSKLSAIVAKLKQPNSQPNSLNELVKPPSLEREKSPIFRWKNYWLASGTIILIGLAGFQIYNKQFSKQYVMEPSIPPQTIPYSRIDYSRLENLLAEKKWKDADKETTTIMLKISRREKEGFLESDKDIKYFRCQDLDNIDRLWMKSSNGRFGFSVQNGIYVMSENPENFYVRVGWFMEGKPMNYDNLTFSQNALRGHFPTASGMLYAFKGTTLILRKKDFMIVSSFFSRFGDDCKLSNETANQPATVHPRQLINETQIPKVGYSLLENLLISKKWKDADEETRNIMLKVFGSEQERWVSDENGQNFSCLTLKKIDQLWLRYSDRRFGYSVQKGIWRNPIPWGVDSTSISSNRLKAFAKDIDWMDGDSWRTRQTFIFSEEAPQGHLPTPIGNSTEMWLQRLFECRDL